jgi:hypothetical protein
MLELVAELCVHTVVETMIDRRREVGCVGGVHLQNLERELAPV